MQDEFYKDVLLELALSIGGEFDLQNLLKQCLPQFLRKLNCTAAAVVNTVENNGIEMCLPRNMSRNKDFVRQLKELALTVDRDSRQKWSLLKDKNNLHYAFRLDDFGMLALVRSRKFEQSFIKEMLPMAVMMARACRSCLEVKKRNQAEKSLRKSRNELQHLNATLEQKVEERSLQLVEVQQKLILKERMAAIGQLAAGAAHELNNPVGFVSMNFETLQEETHNIVEIMKSYKQALQAIPGSREQEILLSQAFELEKNYSLDFVLSDLDKLFEQSRDGFQRIAKIVDSMRNFSRNDSAEEFILFDLNRGIKDTLVLTHNNYKNHAEILTELGDIPEIECIPGEINQVILNIIVNAAQALEDAHMPGPGTIKVRTWADESHVYCDLSNNGPLIEENVRRRIFDAFFTTRSTGMGTGLGLSISYDIIVRKHNGSLSVESNEQHGTTFHIVLPVRQKRV